MKALLALLLVASAGHAKPVVLPINDVIAPELMKGQKRAKYRIRVTPLGPDREKLLSVPTPVVNQWNGTCTAHGLVAGIETLMGPGHNLSERYFWSLYRQYSASVAIRTAQAYPQAEESLWPHDKLRQPANAKGRQIVILRDAPYLGNNVTEILRSIDKGFPVYFASTVPKQMYECKAVVSENTAMMTGAGHAYVVVGYRVKDGKAAFRIKQSWGDWCGDKGYQWIPASICTRPDSYCAGWSLRKVDRI